MKLWVLFIWFSVHSYIRFIKPVKVNTRMFWYKYYFWIIAYTVTWTVMDLKLVYTLVGHFLSDRYKTKRVLSNHILIIIWYLCGEMIHVENIDIYCTQRDKYLHQTCKLLKQNRTEHQLVKTIMYLYHHTCFITNSLCFIIFFLYWVLITHVCLSEYTLFPWFPYYYIYWWYWSVI